MPNTIQYLLPSFLATYLMRGDESSLLVHEAECVQEWMKEHNVEHCIAIDENTRYTSEHNMKYIFLACDCSIYTFELIS